ncbi:MAG TPA: PAS domain-containing protein [Planctomycetota bacterium]|nr:PAS domain-containing protein [Planctomycetota bacterium]
MRLRADFAPALAGHDLADLDRASSSAFAIDPDFVLAYTNDAWDRFAGDNGGDQSRWTIGDGLLEAISGPTHAFFEASYRAVLVGGSPWSFVYECSSPERFREFRLTAYPLPRGRGILVVNACVMERGHARDAATDDVSAYVDGDGIIHQCSHCRCVRHQRHVERWDWVPSLLAAKLPISHGLCGPCLNHHYASDVGGS